MSRSGEVVPSSELPPPEQSASPGQVLGVSLSPVARAVAVLVADGVDPREALWFSDAMEADGKDPVAKADKLLALRASARAKQGQGTGWGQRQPGQDRVRENTLYRP